MYAVTGITGQVGGEVARNLLSARLPVRAIVRSEAKGLFWKERGCEIAIADLNYAKALSAALSGIEAAFILLPPNFDPAPGFPEVRQLAESLRFSIEAGMPKRVVYISTIGAQAATENLLTQHTIAEGVLRDVSVPITFLRPGWFMENASWDIDSAIRDGLIRSFLQPLDKPLPMIATADIGKTAAALLQDLRQGRGIVELEGPRRYSPNDIAHSLSNLLRKPVRVQAVPRGEWESLFRDEGMRNPMPRIKMLDGFNEGWIEFENSEIDSLKGSTELDTVLRGLVREKLNQAKTRP